MVLTPEGLGILAVDQGVVDAGRRYIDISLWLHSSRPIACSESGPLNRCRRCRSAERRAGPSDAPLYDGCNARQTFHWNEKSVFWDDELLSASMIE